MKRLQLFTILLAALLTGSYAIAQTLEEAAALYAESNWQGAADAYQAVVDNDPEDSTAWFGLAQSYHQLGEYGQAERAYQMAEETGFPTILRVYYHLGRVYMSMGDEEKALEQIEAIGSAGGLSSTIIQAVVEFEPLHENPRYLAVIAQLTPCNTDDYRAFDFWLGQWDVTPVGLPAPSAKSSITSIQGGCAVLEEYETQGGFTGISINFYDSNTGKWHQSWMGNGGGAVHLEGHLVGGAMVLSDANHESSEAAGTINKVTWSLLDDGRVRQHWENSSDQGETWTTSFDGYYSAREGEQ